MQNSKVFFNLEPRKNSDGEQLIMINLNYGYKVSSLVTGKIRYIPLRVSTEQKIKAEYWDKVNYRANSKYVKQYGKTLNDRLNHVEQIIRNQIELYRNTNNSEPSPSELKQLVNEKLGRVDKVSNERYLVDYIQSTVKNRTQKEKTASDRISKATAKQYNNLVNHLRKYEKYTGKRQILGKLTDEIYKDFLKVTNEIYYEETGSFLSQTTIAKDVKNLRAVLNIAEEENINVGFNFRKKSLKVNGLKKSYSTYLNLDELSKILDTDTSYSRTFEHARNYIIISSFTGLRISDMVHLHEIEIDTELNNGEVIKFFSTKIRKSPENKSELFVTIPILKPVEQILKNYNGKFPSFPVEQVIRKYIKSFLKHLEIDENVEVSQTYYLQPNPVKTIKKKHEVFSAHDCRATFITNLKQLGMHNEDIEPITHPKIKFTSILDSYDKSSSRERAIQFAERLNQKFSEKSLLWRV